MKLLDRYIIRSFLANYLLALGVLLGTYILLDLIVNFNLFAHGARYSSAAAWPAFLGLLKEIISFYMYRSLVIFQMIAGVIPLLAAGFTMFRMTRHRELTALLASGVSLYRVAAPIVLCALGFTLLVVLDQEVLMPHFVNQLLRKHGQVTETLARHQPIYFLPESDHSLVLASSYNPQDETLDHLRIIERNAAGVPTHRILARRAVGRPRIGEGPRTGGWLLSDVVRVNDRRGTNPNVRPEPVPQMVYTTPLNPGQLKLILRKNAVDYLATAQIDRLILYSPPALRLQLEKIMYTRSAQLVINMIMLLIGIPFLLTREPRRLVGNLFGCSLTTGLCFVTTFVCFQLAGANLSPFLGAWLPVIIFGPLAVVMLDGIKT